MINAWERNIWISEFTPVVSGFRVTRSLVLCFVDLCLSFRTFSCGHCVVCSSSIYTDSDYPFGILWPLRCLFFFDIRILITPLWYLQTFLEDTKAVNGRRTDNTMNTSKKNKFIKYNTVTCILEYLMINSWDEKFKDLYKKVIRSHKSSKNR